MTVEEARMLGGVWERSQRLFEDGYAAKVLSDAAEVQVTNPEGAAYLLDVKENTCTCGFFTGHGGRLPCKHLLGWEKLLEDQTDAAAAAADNPFGEEMKFPLGRLYLTPGAKEALERNGQSPIGFLLRHSSGDWGDICPEDKEANDLDVGKGGRLLSAYHLNDGTKLWIITEADRSSTTALLPQEY